MIGVVIWSIVGLVLGGPIGLLIGLVIGVCTMGKRKNVIEHHYHEGNKTHIIKKKR